MSLQLYRERIALVKKQRDALDEDLAQILAEGLAAGHKMLDLLIDTKVSPQQPGFDL
jgi:hypothetical protein